MKSILFFIFFVISAEANYCIQLESLPLDKKELLVREAEGEKYNAFTDVRVESRQPYSVLRVGDYDEYKDAVKEIFKIRKIHNDAYIRECVLRKNAIIYIKNETAQTDSTKIEQKRDTSVSKQAQRKEILVTKQEQQKKAQIEKQSVETEEIVVEVEEKPAVVTKTAEVSQTTNVQETEAKSLSSFDALAKAYAASNEGDKSTAYNFFSEAIDKCSDASTYNKACLGAILNAPLRRKNIPDPYYVTLYGTAMWYDRAYKPETAFQKNFNDTVYQLKMRAGRYMDEKKKTSLYLFAHIDGDINSKAGSVPVIYSDNYTGVGIGADYRLSPYSRLFVETSFENNLIHNAGVDNTQFDYRAGVDFYKRWGPATDLACSYNPRVPLKWFSDFYAAAVFYSRYNNNVILQSSGRLGINFLTYRMSSLGAYAYVGVTADTNGDYYNNIAEVGPGLEYKPYETIPFSIRSEYRFSKFFKNVPDGETDRFNTLLIYGIFYFEQ